MMARSAKCSEISAIKTIEVQTMFTRYGLPEHIVTDNGPQFASTEFKTLMKQNGVRQRTLPPSLSWRDCKQALEVGKDSER